MKTISVINENAEEYDGSIEHETETVVRNEDLN